MPLGLGYRDRRVVVTGRGGLHRLPPRRAPWREGASVRALVRYSSRADAGNLRFIEADSQRAWKSCAATCATHTSCSTSARESTSSSTWRH